MTALIVAVVWLAVIAVIVTVYHLSRKHDRRNNRR